MHQYLRAIGFSNIKSKKELRELLSSVIEGSDNASYIKTDRNSTISEHYKMFAGPCGIVLRGEIEEDKNLTLDFYYPFLMPSQISSGEELSIERHAEKESFAGILEDIKVGATMIFYLQNGVEYMKMSSANTYEKTGHEVKLSGLSTSGTILLPIKKNAKEVAKVKQLANDRREKLVQAREGNEEAIESLTLDDIDMYSAISRRIQKEDVFSLVDTYFMPYGIECDQYSVLAEIEDFEYHHNYITDEEICVLKLNMNEFKFDVCINREDLFGEPEIGRRFKGSIWLQGRF